MSRVSGQHRTLIVTGLSIMLASGCVQASSTANSPPSSASISALIVPATTSTGPATVAVGSTVTATSASPDPAEVVRTVLAALDPTSFVDAHIGVSPDKLERQGLWFYATLAAKDQTPQNLNYALWQGYTAQGAVAARLYSAESISAGNGFVGSTFDLRLSNGSVVPEAGGGTGYVSYGVRNKESDVQIRTRINTIAEKFGMRVGELELFHPLETAIAVTIVVPDVKLLVGNAGTITTAIQQPTSAYESFYVDFVSSSGQQLSIQYGDRLVGMGSQWYLPGHDEYGTGHSDYPTPPVSTASSH